MNHVLKDSVMYSYKMAVLSKALWKSVERDWQAWIKPFDLNLNEHHILWIAYQSDGASISDIATHGVMHVSTAFNFSKKLESRGLLTFSKKEEDKRNTYICLTSAGKALFCETMSHFNEKTYNVYQGTLPIKELYGKFPEFSELISVLRHLYGNDFIDQFDHQLLNFTNELEETEGKLSLNPN
ncbi:protease production regulatory protein Hpr [Bacillus sp. JCM 19046]|uniref:MarR family protease production transcriptional regulator HPr n=1 Tax=Shouchella xiaoxiensis TaxID=766895 RepID=A0ABS2SR46_9BACI|nr:HTH-type transcriptional regulator Hpr [Shouchella xiaoxiensis]MBM7837966.1 MarR family protease production transcriptional regulator HPr [Shouchella xiaoxiensis]GAF12267.1 protease production regulatory protein Hpr [Bacillus sp. JCM 19045]GAF18650.1 protease production regulatory protein Hpr [Bacillus sp. JCM 19046]